MWFHVLACDYDGTLATDGRIAAETIAALGRMRRSGRRLLLVTGRQFEDLLAVCPEIDAFDLVVAENGAVLYEPRGKRVEDLASPPPAAFLRALESAAIPFSTGRVIVSSVVPHEGPILDVIKRLGLELQIVFNKEAVMVLPAAVSKESGLSEALRRLGMSPHNTVAVGDAENDHAFLRRTGFAVAVANAVPALAETADLVTRAPNGAGVRELIDGPLADDLDAYRPYLLERTVPLGARADGTPVGHPVMGPNLLVAGDSVEETTAVAGVFVERLVRDDYVVCLLDPAGDYCALAEHEGLVVLASEPAAAETRAGEVERLVRHRSTSVAIDLSALDDAEKVRATAIFLGAVDRLRGETGAPHWVVVGRAHAVLPAGAAAGIESRGVCLVTSEPARLAPELAAVAPHIVSTSADALTAGLALVRRGGVPGGALAPGEALDVSRGDDGAARVGRFRIAPREPRDRRRVAARDAASGRGV